MINNNKMAAIQRLTDSDNGGGSITNIPQSTVFANNRLVSINGSTGTTHPPGPGNSAHKAGIWKTANGQPNVFVNNTPVNKTGNADTCGHVRIDGSSNVFVG